MESPLAVPWVGCRRLGAHRFCPRRSTHCVTVVDQPGLLLDADQRVPSARRRVLGLCFALLDSDTKDEADPGVPRGTSTGRRHNLCRDCIGFSRRPSVMDVPGGRGGARRRRWRPPTLAGVRYPSVVGEPDLQSPACRLDWLDQLWALSLALST